MSVQKCIGPCETDVLVKERERIEQSRGARIGPEPSNIWCGLGLSGGGIRSASLALGVLQALAEKDVLKHFDFLSTVSGGGYIGASLQWWWRKPKPGTTTFELFGLGPRNFPYGAAHPVWSPSPQGRKKEDDDATASETAESRGARNLLFLRNNGSYLTPGDGLNIWSMIAVVLRTVIISLMVWIPILIGIFLIVNLLDSYYVAKIFKEIEPYVALRPFGDRLFGIDSPYRWLSDSTDVQGQFRYPAIFAVLLILFYLVLFVFVCAAALFALLSRAPQETKARTSVGKILLLLVLTISVIYILLNDNASVDFSVQIIVAGIVVFDLVAFAIIIADRVTDKSLNPSYGLRRTVEKILGLTFVPTLAVLALATIPLIPLYASTHDGDYAKYFNGGLLGAFVGLLGGTASTLYSYYLFIRSIAPTFAIQIAVTVGAALYLYAMLVTAYVVSILLWNTELFRSDDIWLTRAASSLTIGLALAIGFVANINYAGLHRFYRDRLMEAFMPTDESAASGHVTYSSEADSLNVSDLVSSLDASEGFVPRPYPLINANAILIGDKDRRVAVRGGDNFVISPLFVGSSSTGWRDTKDYIAANGPLTLATAMAASGAAATASAGYIGTGITMNPIVSAAMAFLNIRLGLWIGNPGRRPRRPWRMIPTFLKPGLYSGILARRRSRRSSFIELTDGGHFENLALYELVRRKLDVILIVDGEADPDISLSSLVSAAHRIEQDFGARLTFVDGKGPESLMMYPEKGYPKDLKFARSPFVVARLDYNDKTFGALIYVKSTLIKHMNFMTSGYLAKNPEFPHQSTVDQFFDPDQFDAYRLLGYENAMRMIGDLGLEQNIRRPDVLLS